MSATTTTSWILELVDKATAPLRAIDKVSKQVSGSVTKINAKIKTLTKRSDVLSGRLKKMAVAGAAFALLGNASLQFEDGMARANTMAEVGEKQLAQYTKQIKNIATVVPVAKKELAEGLYNTISAGVPKSNWITFLNDSSKASIAGNAELGLVVDATASTIKAYGDSWENANKVQDRFQKTVQLGQIPSLQALATALPRVTAVSSKLKVSQEEMLSVFATASGVMGSPAEVATQFNAVLSAMLKPGAEATKMANQLGVAFDAKSISRAGGLQNYIEELIPKIKAYSEQTGQTQEQIIGNLFGSQEAIKLVIGLGGELSSSWATNTNKLGKATGSVQRAFAIMSKTTKTQLQLLRNSFGNVIDGIFVVLAPLLQMLLKGAMYVMHLVSSFMETYPAISKFIIITGATLFLLFAVATAVTLVSLKLQILKLRFLRAALSSNALTSGLARVTLAVWGYIKAGSKQLILLAGQATGYLLSGAYMLGSFLVGLVSSTAAMWGLNIAMNANPIGLIVIGIAAAIGIIVVLIKYWDKIKEAIVKFSAWLYDHSPFAALVNILDKVFPGFKDKIAALGQWVKDLLLGVWESIKQVWVGIKEFFGFGEDETSIEIDVNKKINQENLLADPAGTIDLEGNQKTPTTTNSQNTVSGGGSGGKILTMSLDITNNFNLGKGNWRGEMDDIADNIVGKINDRLRDGAIALG